ncbi:MAG TPA: peroxiredoxin [Anaerolineae bacterium]|nr:peroxiredoxin [Anaerolineae bacterium]
MMLQVGDVAPDFELPASGNRLIKLSNFRGKKKVLLAFYPFAFSPVCSLQLPGLQENLDKFQALNTEVLGISVDSKHSSTAFAEHLKLDFPLVSDFNKEITAAFGVLREGGFAERALFVIDKDGKIAYAHVNPIGEVPDNTPVFEVLERLQ